MNNLNTNEQLDHLLTDAGLKIKEAEWFIMDNPDFTIIRDEKEYHFEALFKDELHTNQVPAILEKAGNYKPVLIIAKTIYPKYRKVFRETGINYIELTGNMYIKREGLYVYTETVAAGKRKIANRIKDPFTKNGVLLLFYLLHNPAYLNYTKRQMNELTGVSLGNISYLFRSMEEEKIITRFGKNDFRFTDYKKTLGVWAEQYIKKLRDDFFAARMKPAYPEFNEKWQETELQYPETVWGGEQGAYLMLRYLRPVNFTIYTTEEKKEFALKYKLIPDRNGNLMVYRKFWNNAIEEKIKGAAPAIIIYAELLAINDARAWETAEMIYDQYIKQKPEQHN